MRHAKSFATIAIIAGLSLSACTSKDTADIDDPEAALERLEEEGVIDADANPARELTEDEKALIEQRETARLAANKLVGHVSLARLALAQNMADEAGHHVRRAQNIAAELTDAAPSMTVTSHFNYGKIDYRDETTERDYLVPLVDDVALIDDFRVGEGEDEIEETGAEFVRLWIGVDVEEANRLLEVAGEALEKGENADAALALDELGNTFISDEQVVTNPLWSVRGNIALAHTLLKEERYNAAAHAVRAALTRLEELDTKDLPGTRKAEMGELEATLRGVIEAIEKDEAHERQEEYLKQLDHRFDYLNNLYYP